MSGRTNIQRAPTPPAEALAPSSVPVARPRLPTADRLLPYLEQMDAARWYSNFGPMLTTFEARLADRLEDGAHVVTCANATQGLALTLRALNVAPGSLCIVPSFTFVATAHAIVEAGLAPLFLDVDPDSWTLRPNAARDAVRLGGGHVGAIVVVAPFGAPFDAQPWLELQAAAGIPVVVDAAAGFDTLAAAPLPTVVSLHATKVLGVGEGGYLATRHEGLAARVRQMTTFGFQGSRTAEIPATNAKLSEYAGAVGQAALADWPHDRLRLLRTAQMLRVAMTDLPEVRFQPGWGVDWVTSVCCVALPDGAAEPVAARLLADGVETRRWWGGGCHENPAFDMYPSTELPETERLGACVLGLPFSVDLSAEEIERIAAALRRALRA